MFDNFAVMAKPSFAAAFLFVLTVAAPLAAMAEAESARYCFEDAARRYNHHPDLLRAISHTESRGNPMAQNINKDGSIDIGHMQINSRWLPTLARYGIHRRHLHDPCVSTYVGAWILADNVRRHGYNWTAIGAYNARSPEKRARYARLVAQALKGAGKS